MKGIVMFLSYLLGSAGIAQMVSCNEIEGNIPQQEVAVSNPGTIQSFYNKNTNNKSKHPSGDKSKNNSAEKVLICDGTSSKKYHKDTCYGLRNCRGELKWVTLAEAEKVNRTPCGICYR